MPTLQYPPDTAAQVVATLHAAIECTLRLYVLVGRNGQATFFDEPSQGYVELDSDGQPALRETRTSSIAHRFDPSRIVLIRESASGDLLYRHATFKPAFDWPNAAIAYNAAETDLWELWATPFISTPPNIRTDDNGKALVVTMGTRPQLARYLDKRKRFDI